jgi:sugar phosphate isomerase/epimerase
MKYSLFSLTLPEYTPAQAAKLIKDAGYDGVEWRCHTQPDPLPVIPDFWKSNRTTLDVNHWQKQAPEYKKISSDHGLEISTLTTYCHVDEMDEIKVAIEIAKAVGSPRFRVQAPHYDGKTHFNEMFKKARAGYEQTVELCKKANLTALMELHFGGITPSASIAHRLIDGLDPKHIGVIFDPGNMVIEGYENWKLGCELLGPYLNFVHAKNSRLRAAGTTKSGAVKWEYEPCEYESGFADWVEVYKALKAVQYNGWVSNEDHHVKAGVSSFDMIKNGLQYLKKCESLA